ncbi:N-6 DNA methylase [Propionivibrio soli]|uniref:N-6 DNA methylase n=1 Tax=Propionivibrio soli TaxID=2976531 RepID=UPI0021E81E24|nr:N-6 DNA methylase [Propionivibrio soli]
MLDTETKRRIDACRDILVGKVPDPKSQVEQITIALIYKFMDDMDAEAEELGGKRSFFAGEYAKYGWAKLMAPSLGGHDVLNLYSEAIGKMTENPGIPPLFRDIFKNAYLPYRDPETLRSFLKEIDTFTYDHSERLGDAFEYLLSVLGSQGDAGQFRTPRHIIDFMVEVINPQKHESILDPACGTAGFLISAWKHILKQNSSPRPQGEGPGARVGDQLTPDQRQHLAANIHGYDISPDMVRLSLVNMYLHGFTDPHIVEYDTLTSEEKWNETADVILANPPFMSPKGGIKPHKRFSIQAKRSEVLFVDYMAEHLSPTGRAAIIVPEGVIFQSQTAYKQLRELLVKTSLVAVVSLPAGCFNPYSGVKTSILILDKSVARRSNTIAFFKVENDGFGLGAQRRAIDKNDLPQVKAELAQYLQALRSGKPVDELQPTCGLIVAKEKIVANGEYNLSGERYRDGISRSSNYPTVPIGDICELFNGRAFKPEEWEDAGSGGVPIVRIQNLNNADSSFNYFTGEVSERNTINNGELLFSWSGSRGTSFGAHIWKGQKAVLNQHIFKVGFDESRATKMYLLHALNKAVTEVEENLHGGVGLVHITKGNLEKIEIPLPPLEVQMEIVAKIEGYQKVINGARAVLDNYRPQIHIHPEWPKRNLGGLAKNLDSRRVPITKGDRKAGLFPYYGASGIVDYVADFIFDEDILLISEDGANLLARSTPIAFSVSGKCWVNNHAHVLKFAQPATQKFVEVYLNSISIEEFVTGAAQPKLNQDALSRIPIPIPDDLATQQAIVAEIEAEQKLVAANRELIARFEKKIQATLARVWGEEEAPDAPDA